MEEAISLRHHVVQISASIGVARVDEGDDAASVIRRADAAMYAAKAAGRGQVKLADDRRRTNRAEIGRSVIGRRRPSDGRVNLATVESAIAGMRILVQPIVDIRTGLVRAVEALARGPVGHPLEYPDELFPTATTFGRLAEVELEAKRLAFALPLPDDVQLFINLEAILLADPTWLERMQVLWAVAGVPAQPVVAEITERAVLTSPGRLLAAVDACRSLGWRIALDDVGVRTESLTALRWVRPDVIKLDTGLISGENATHMSQVAAAVAAYRDVEPAAEVVAEGLEHDRHLALTSLLGADLVQGYLIGRPSPLSEVDYGVRSQVRTFADVNIAATERIGTKRDLLALSRHVESVALTSDTVLLAALQRDEFLSTRTRRQYAAIARRCGFVGLLGQDLIAAAGSTMPGARIADLNPDDPLIERWEVVAVSPTTSIALLATEIDTPSDIEDMDRLFRYRFLTERRAVDAAARELLLYF